MAMIWDSSSGRFLWAIDVSPEGQRELNFAAFSPDGKCIATVGLGSELIIWNLEEVREGRGGRIGRVKCPQGGRINYVQFNRSGTLLVTASDEDTKIWDIRDVTNIRLWMSLERHKGRTLCAVFSPDDAHLVTTGADDKVARLWDIRPRFSRLGDAPPREQTLLQLVTTIQKESPWEIRNGELRDRLDPK